MRYRFSDADRERLGITSEWVEFDVGKLMLDEAMGLEESGYDVDEFLEEFRGQPVYKNGEPVMLDLVDEKGAPVLDEEGKPKQVQKLRPTLRAVGAAMWIAARRGGSSVPFEGFTFEITGMRSEAEPEGKGDSPGRASGSSASSTRSRSRRSSASSRGK